MQDFARLNKVGHSHGKVSKILQIENQINPLKSLVQDFARLNKVGQSCVKFCKVMQSCAKL